MDIVDFSLAKSILDSWVVVGFQCHSIVPMMLIGTLWFLAAAARRREIRAVVKRKQNGTQTKDLGT